MLCATCAAQDGLVYSRILPLLGSQNDTAITAMTSDAAGNIYLTGWTEEPGLPVTAGVVQPKFSGGSCTNGSPGGGTPTPPPTFTCPDAFVVKLDANSKIVFATYLSSGGFEQATSIGLDATGNIYVAGIATAFPTIPGSEFTGGATFIVKLNPSATSLLYTASIPGTGPLPFLMPSGPNTPPPGAVMSMAVDSAGNAYFTANGTAGFPVTANPIDTKGGIVVGKLDPTGQNLVYATYLGGSGSDAPAAIAIDAAGNAYLTGSTNSADFPTTKGVFQPAWAPGSGSAFVAKLNSSGNGLIYATYLGGASFALGERISVDSSGNAYVLGIGDIPVTPGAYQSNYNPESSAFLAKLNADATSLVYATYVSANSIPPVILQVDAAGNAYLSGQAGPGFVVSPDALQPCRAGGADAFVLQLAPDGAFVAATYLGGSGEDLASALNVVADGTVVLAGLTTTADFLVTPDSPLSPPGFFIAKFQIANPGNATQPCSILAPENSANFQDGPVAPGELVTFWGLRFGPEAGTQLQFDSSGKVTTELAGVWVFFDQFQAPILYAQSEQINAQVPWELAGQNSAQVHVEYNGVSTRTGVVTLQPSAPALFPAQYGAAQGAIVNQDGTRNSAANPAPAGSVVSIYGTGGGATNPGSLTGGIAPLKPPVTLGLTTAVIIDNTVSADVQYAGVAPTLISGLFQINFQIPQNLGANAAHRVDVKIGNTSTEGLISVTLATK
jgi:uncharacterized protein (TIGR03437 family)